jgi:hypothetical protein
MRTNNTNLETFTVRFAWGFVSTVLLLFLVLVLLLAAGLTTSSFAQDAQPRRFASAGEAANALFEAAKKEDETAVEAILGAGKEVTSSSDELEDKLEREQFSQKYQEMHRLVRESDGSIVLYIGAENWPFPLPLVSANGGWYFDSDRGKQEILFRRIGENEATAIDVCEEFAMEKNDGDGAQASEDFIIKFVQSLVSTATTNAGNKESTPFHGYYFRIVGTNSTPQGSRSTQTNARLTLVAYPAEYKSSGVLTFVVSQDGIVYQRDLGAGTGTLAPQVKAPSGSSWRPATKG